MAGAGPISPMVAVAPAAAVVISEKLSPGPATEPHPELKPEPVASSSNTAQIEEVAVGCQLQPDLAEEDLFDDQDQDDAQSFIQPAISQIATRLTSPKTPAAEKAAAMDRLPGGSLFDVLDEQEFGSPQPSPSVFAAPPGSSSPKKVSAKLQDADLALSQASSTLQQQQQQQSSPALVAPSHASPREWVVTDSPRNSFSGVFGTQIGRRQQRSFTISENRLKRLSKALPSISLPQGFIQNLHAPAFLNTYAAPSPPPLPKEEPPSQPQKAAESSKPPSSTQSYPPPVQESHRATSHIPPIAENGPADPLQPQTQATLRPISVTSRRSHVLRRSTSDDSLLYHSLSRVSSFGDDDRFAHIREQVNSRLKAIKDSWEGPTFKLPQLPNILPSPWKLQPAENSPDITVRPGSVQGLRGSKDAGLSVMDTVLESLTGDIVIMGGYRGSILRSAQPPHRQLWVPVKVGLNMRKVNMEVGLDPQDEEDMEKHIFASGMLQNIGPVDVSRRFFRKLRESENARNGKLRVHDYGYDWRLSPHLLSRKLNDFLAKLPSNQPGTPCQQRGALVISHSLGGLITRHAVNQRPDLFSGVIFVGTPQRCINILGPLRNGDAVLLNEKVLTAQVNFSLRTSFAFLPEDGFCFVDKTTKEEYPVDFYNVDDWIKYRLSPCVSEPVLPPFLSRNSTFSSLLSLPDSLSNLPLRARGNSQSKKEKDRDRTASVSQTSQITMHDITRRAEEAVGDRTLAPQMGSSSSAFSHSYSAYLPQQSRDRQNSSSSQTTRPTHPHSPAVQARNVAYLRRVLAETKRFRSELAHRAEHEAGNRYPPLAVIYGKDTPTVHAARVCGREAIGCADAYEDLVFRGGDGVVLARESMLPPGYALVRGGRVCTDRGHVTMLGDLPAVGRALEAVVRGRRKGIGLGGEMRRSEKS